MALRAGRLNRRVSIEQVTRTADGGGGYTEGWAAIPNGTVWARVSPLSGSERFDAQQVQGTLTTEVEIRYRSDVTSAMRVNHGGRLLYIAQPPYSPEDKRESLVMVCEERQA
jgi:SPP1 family predicted phage head-tail adaptor